MPRKMKPCDALYLIDLEIGKYFENARKNQIKYVPFSITADELLKNCGPSIRLNCLANYGRNSLRRSIDIALCDIKKREMQLEAAKTNTTSARVSFRLIFNSLVNNLVRS